MTFMDHFVYNVNIRGAILGTKHAARVMIPAKASVILATASTASVLGAAEPIPHNVGRLAMAGLMKIRVC
ncbi:hypothetical protein M758_5G191400 [Ceratodon purpureus]|nr:hypothetical protein M758_5G191400 [Ceratodon purpureus]